MKNNILRLSSLFIGLVVLTACAGKSAPDEMAVIEGPSLAVPPDYDLRPPREVETYRDEQATKETQKIILGSDGEIAPATGEDGWLINATGANAADPYIREKLTEEVREEIKEDKKSWLTKKKEELFGSDEEETE